MQNIVLIGNKGSGKDTIASFLPHKRYAYADLLKFCTASCFDIPLHKFNDRRFKDRRLRGYCGLTPRDLLIRFGEKGFRDIPALQVTFERYQLAMDNLCLRLKLKRPVLAQGGIKQSVPDFWSKALLSRLQYESEPWIITDCRFAIEVEQLKTAFPNALFVQVERYNQGSEDLSEVKKACSKVFFNNENNLLYLKDDVEEFFQCC